MTRPPHRPPPLSPVPASRPPAPHAERRPGDAAGAQVASNEKATPTARPGTTRPGDATGAPNSSTAKATPTLRPGTTRPSPRSQPAPPGRAQTDSRTAPSPRPGVRPHASTASARARAAAMRPLAAGQPAWLGWIPPRGFDRLREYALLMRLDRPVGWLLLLWPTWWALWLAAEGMPGFGLFAIFSLGVILTRSAGCIVNDYADRGLDRHVERTRERPFARGSVSAREALVLFVLIMGSAFLLVAQTNRLTMLLSVVALLLAIAYPLMKRVLWTPQVVLGLAFGMGIPMAFAATLDSVPAIAWLLLAANVLWSVAYDTYYAMVDREDDLVMGAKSTAILFGDADLVAIAIVQVSFLVAMALVGDRAGLGPAYWIGWGAAVFIAGACHWLARTRLPADCLRAFRLNHWVGAALWLGMAAHYAIA